MWNVPREEYEFTRPDGRPAVAPYDFSGKRGIVECSDMGGGKTYQMEQLIFSRAHGTRSRVAAQTVRSREGAPTGYYWRCLPGDMKEMLLAFEKTKPFVGGKGTHYSAQSDSMQFGHDDISGRSRIPIVLCKHDQF